MHEIGLFDHGGTSRRNRGNGVISGSLVADSTRYFFHRARLRRFCRSDVATDTVQLDEYDFD